METALVETRLRIAPMAVASEEQDSPKTPQWCQSPEDERHGDSNTRNGILGSLRRPKSLLCAISNQNEVKHDPFGETEPLVQFHGAPVFRPHVQDRHFPAIADPLDQIAHE